MKIICTSKESQEIDKYLINQKHIPSIVLMENAAKSCAEFIFEQFLANPGKILILCGVGNNGGDGFAIARHMQCKLQYNNISNIFEMIDVVIWGDINKLSEDAKTNYNLLKELDINTKHIQNLDDINSIENKYDHIIDALIGSAGSENLRGNIVELLQYINTLKAIKYSIDIPTGYNSNTAKKNKDCFKANYTLTMFSKKLAFVIDPEKEKYLGEIKIIDLGVRSDIINHKRFEIEKSDYRKLIKKRNKTSSKFDFGRVFIIAGSMDYLGASALQANSASISGAGLVELYSVDRHVDLLADVIFHQSSQYKSKKIKSKYLTLDDFDEIIELSKKSDVICIGSGMGNHPQTIELIEKLIKYLSDSKKIIIDADALIAFKNILQSEIEIKWENIIITPHLGEFARLINKKYINTDEDLESLAVDFASKYKVNLHLKSYYSISTNSEKIYYTSNGNPALSKGGSGDCLVGIIAAMLAQNVDILEACALGSFIHAECSNYYVNKQNFESENFLASDMFRLIPKIIKKMNKNKNLKETHKENQK